MTSKQVILSIINVINGNAKFMSTNMRIELRSLLAHVFKKFPKLWNISWMYAKSRDELNKRWLRYHRLKTSVYSSAHVMDDKYYASSYYYNDYIRLYIPGNGHKHEED